MTTPQPIVLAVDDEPAILELTRWTLRRDFQVITATGGAQGLILLDTHAVALVISDLRMPGMSGLEFLAEARERHPHVVRVLSTAYTTHDDALRAVNEVGVFKVIAKPWMPGDLVEVVRDGLGHWPKPGQKGT